MVALALLHYLQNQGVVLSHKDMPTRSIARVC
jgi:hypothetical protein